MLCCLGSLVKTVLDLRPRGPRFDPEQADYIYWTVLANTIGGS